MVERLAASFARALVLVHDPLRLTRVLGLSLLAWCFELGLFFVLLGVFGLPMSYPLALLVGCGVVERAAVEPPSLSSQIPIARLGP